MKLKGFKNPNLKVPLAFLVMMRIRVTVFVELTHVSVLLVADVTLDDVSEERGLLNCGFTVKWTEDLTDLSFHRFFLSSRILRQIVNSEYLAVVLVTHQANLPLVVGFFHLTFRVQIASLGDCGFDNTRIHGRLANTSAVRLEHKWNGVGTCCEDDIACQCSHRLNT